MGRGKHPEALRQALLDQAIALIVEKGLTALTTDAVAKAAGVSKGGLFHHFSSKPALIEAVGAELLSRLDQAIDARLGPETMGQFTRAYLQAILHDLQGGWTRANILLLSEPSMQHLWDQWIEARLHRHAATDSGPDLAILRLAADGIWLGQASSCGQGVARADLLQRLEDWLNRV